MLKFDLDWDWFALMVGFRNFEGCCCCLLMLNFNKNYLEEEFLLNSYICGRSFSLLLSLLLMESLLDGMLAYFLSMRLTLSFGCSFSFLPWSIFSVVELALIFFPVIGVWSLLFIMSVDVLLEVSYPFLMMLSFSWIRSEIFCYLGWGTKAGLGGLSDFLAFSD